MLPMPSWPLRPACARLTRMASCTRWSSAPA
uniref:Alternative protein n=1 Tax=Macrostomum lignano TaxID=282301 RepID=A0A1I8GQI0_9PLAT